MPCIPALCHFEIQARLTEPGVLVADFEQEHYAKFLQSLQLEFARDNAIFIAADGNQVVGRCLRFSLPINSLVDRVS